MGLIGAIDGVQANQATLKRTKDEETLGQVLEGQVAQKTAPPAQPSGPSSGSFNPNERVSGQDDILDFVSMLATGGTEAMNKEVSKERFPMLSKGEQGLQTLS